jgi:hypothetical protein
MLKILTMLGAGIPAIIASILTFLTRKVGTATATIISFGFITAGMILCINVILQTVLSLIVMPPWISNAVGMFIPIDFTAVLSSIVSSRICRMAYDMAKFKIVSINAAI